MTCERQPRSPGLGVAKLELDPGAVAVIDGRTVARSLPVWLRVFPAEAFPGGRWVKVRYSASFFDDPVRPLVKFETAAGRVIIEPMNGAVLGTGEWSGPVPEKTVAVSISPVTRLGPFDFRIESVEVISRARFLLNAATFATGRSLRLGTTTTPLEAYHGWYLRHAREMDLEGIDRPRREWDSAPLFLLILRLAGASIEDLQATVRSLQRQAYRRWLLVAITDDADADVIAAYRDRGRDEPRLLESEGDKPLSTFASRLKTDDCISIVQAGDILPDNSLAIIAEKLAGESGLLVVYGDEDAVARDGVLHSPLLKPDWSPVLQRGAPYIGRLTCVRFGILDGSKSINLSEWIAREESLLEILDGLPRESIGHIRRILHRRRSEPEQVAKAGRAAVKPTPRKIEHGSRGWPEVTIVVPTRDMAGLLSACVKGLKEKTDYPHYQVVIMDNGSRERDALALLNDLRHTPRFTVLDRPGPFNFSDLCNEGARFTATPMLVFLNNDISMIDGDWLKPLVRWAMQPDIGAVGAKLLFSSGAIQHAGVVVGLGGIAGHFYRKERSDIPGNLCQLVVTREVTAVTAACVAIERAKFDAVGGFDADNLPVELNDVDLCLRIAERGWSNLWTPEAVLCHHEFGSRRIGLAPSKAYRGERLRFLQRWQNVIRDDPFFHPGFSLFSFRPTLP